MQDVLLPTLKWLMYRCKRKIVPLFAATLFMSAFLMFWLQLMTAKLLLPHLGGSAAVWNTCTVFFQVLLLLGYSYAHWSQRLPLKIQAIAQIGIVAIPLLTLPVQLSINWVDLAHPIPGLLLVLATGVGFPFFAVSTLSPLLQRWLGSVDASVNPYLLFVASNGGSLLSLAAYPLLIERFIALTPQTYLWSSLYLVMGCAVVLCALLTFQIAQVQTTTKLDTTPEIVAPAPTLLEKLRWTAIAFLPSSLMLGVTTYITTDIAPIPMFWSLTLGIYLFSFIVTFSDRTLLQRKPVFLSILLVGAGMLFLVANLVRASQVSLHLFFFALIAWICHDRLAQQKPAPEHLTTFYLCLSLGGALGGFFNSIVAPLLFRGFWEYALVMSCCVFLLQFPKSAFLQRFRLAICCAAFSLILVGFWFFNIHSSNSIFVARSFFGAYNVRKIPPYKVLVHGTTLHGGQDITPGKTREPILYYAPGSPVDEIFTQASAAQSIAIMGLGSGGMAAYAKPDQQWDFYEIDPLIEDIARTQFTFLAESPAPTRVIIGDGRLALAQQSKTYDIIVLDAFNSGAIPTHLLTQEAIKLYLAKLNPGGIIVFHISNRFLELSPMLHANALQLELASIERKLPMPIPSGEKKDSSSGGRLHYVVLAQPKTPVLKNLEAVGWRSIPTTGQAWTDDFSNVFTVLRHAR